MPDRNRTELFSMSWNYEEYVKFELKHFHITQEATSNAKLVHFKFKQSIFTKKKIAAARIAGTRSNHFEQKTIHKTFTRFAIEMRRSASLDF